MPIGWEPVSPDDEPIIEAAWARYLKPADNLLIPKPSRMWRGQELARHRENPELEAEFSLKLLLALRKCTPPGERLFAIDWQHSWYYFDPNMVTIDSRPEWPMPFLPNGDAHHYIAPDFSFGVITGWRETGPVTLFGAKLVSEIAADPPVMFLRVCGKGHTTIDPK